MCRTRHQPKRARWLLGAEIKGNFEGECEDIQVKYLHYPRFNRTGAPTLRETSNRPTYLSMNVQKTCTGNFQFGAVTYVVAPSPVSQFFVVPFDTGVYARDFARAHGGELPFGTLDALLHLLEPHFETLL